MKTSFFPHAIAAWALAAAGMLTAPVSAAGLPASFDVPDEQIAALGIRTAPLQRGTDAVRAAFPAQVTAPPGAEQIVSSAVPGLVSQILVQQYQEVQPGTPLLRIASPELGQLQLQLLQSSARATLTHQTAQRERRLFDEGIIPRSRVEEAQTALKEADAALAQARAALRLSGMSTKAVDDVVRTGNLQDSVTLDAAQAGIVTDIAAKPGQRVEAATALMNLVQTGALWLDIQIPSAESRNWPAGTPVTVVDRGVSAKILSASPTISSTSQTVVLRAEVHSGSRLRLGELVTVQLPVDGNGSSWDVPLSAVAYDNQQPYVFVRNDSGFDARAVSVIASTGQWVRVDGALAEGEQIAVSGVVALKGAWLGAAQGDE